MTTMRVCDIGDEDVVETASTITRGRCNPMAHVRFCDSTTTCVVPGCLLLSVRNSMRLSLPDDILSPVRCNRRVDWAAVLQVMTRTPYEHSAGVGGGHA